VSEVPPIGPLHSPRRSKPEVSVPGVSPSHAPLAIPPDEELAAALATLVAAAAAEDVTGNALLELTQTELLPQVHPASCLFRCFRLSHPLEGSAPSVGAADERDVDSSGQLHCAAEVTDVIEAIGAEAVVHGISVAETEAETEDAVQAQEKSSLLARLRFASDRAVVVASHPDGGVSPSQSELDDVAAPAADEVVGQALALLLLLLLMVLTAFAELVDGCSDGAAEEVITGAAEEEAAAAEDVATTVAPQGVVVVAVAQTVEVLYADDAGYV
jgi:hypothetical protein